MKKISVLFLVVAGAAFSGGCGKAEPQHVIRPPDPPGDYKVPRTKQEKIAAIQKAEISEDMKKAAIAKVNAGPGP